MEALFHSLNKKHHSMTATRHHQEGTFFSIVIHKDPPEASDGIQKVQPYTSYGERGNLR